MAIAVARIGTWCGRGAADSLGSVGPVLDLVLRLEAAGPGKAIPMEMGAADTAGFTTDVSLILNLIFRRRLRDSPSSSSLSSLQSPAYAARYCCRSSSCSLETPSSSSSSEFPAASAVLHVGCAWHGMCGARCAGYAECVMWICGVWWGGYRGYVVHGMA